MTTLYPYRTTDSPLQGGEGGVHEEHTQGEVQHLTHAQVKAHYAQSKARMVRKLLALGYNMGYDKPTTLAEQRMKRWEVCKLHLNRWLLSDHSAVRMEMDDMTHKQLTIVITQLEKVYRDYLKRIS